MTDDAEQLPPAPDESAGIQDAFAGALERYQAAFGSKDIDGAEGALHDIFALADAFADENPSEDFQLTLQANDCEERGDWEGAEAAYRRQLDLAGVDPLGMHRAHVSLYSLFKLLGRDADAFEHARLASLAARQIEFREKKAGRNDFEKKAGRNDFKIVPTHFPTGGPPVINLESRHPGEVTPVTSTRSCTSAVAPMTRSASLRGWPPWRALDRGRAA